MHQPPLQIIEDKQVSIKIPDISSFEDEAFAAPLNSDFLEETLTIPVSHKEIRSKSAEIVEGSSTRIEAVRRLNTFVFDYMAKDPTIGVPNGLLALRSAKGDCNEHTALFVSLARAAQIPTRITAGLVYSERAGPRKSFYYHAWAEVLLQDTWVPVDPTFGQFPADATHIKVVEGDLDKQISIMGLLGNISLKLIDTK
jgi:transglutaminase-like putative cysteine protease